MHRLLVALLLSTSAVLGYAVSQATAPQPSSAREAPVAAGQATMLPLQRGDFVVAGAPDGADGAWVLARSEGAEGTSAYHVGVTGVQLRVPLPLTAAGRLGGIAVDGGTVWAASGQAVVALEANTGVVVRTLTLPRVAAVASHAQRTPDGTVLGLGQATSLAASSDGIWVGRYAAHELTLIDRSGAATPVALPEDVDAKAFTVDTVGTVWFTTNFGPTDQLGAFIGRITPARTVVLIPGVTASIASGPAGMQAVGRDWRRLDASARATATRALPAQTDASAATVTSTDALVLRGAREAVLHVYSDTGAEVRRIEYAAGSFLSRAGSLATTARLQFLFTGASGTIWFAPEASGFIYRAT